MKQIKNKEYEEWQKYKHITTTILQYQYYKIQYNTPCVRVLDEATASLDVENETKVQEALSRLLADKTVLVIAHRMRTVQVADKIVVRSEGRVAEEGSPTRLLAKQDGIFRRMTQLQTASAGWSIA